MRNSPLLLLALVALCFLGAAKKPALEIRFHCLANEKDGESFSSTINVGTPPRPVTIQKVPAVSERSITAIYPFQAADGTWACTFKLDAHGSIGLDTLSVENRGSVLIAIVNGRVASVMKIDRRVSDGIVTIGSGLTPGEIELMAKKFKILGQRTKKS